ARRRLLFSPRCFLLRPGLGRPARPVLLRPAGPRRLGGLGARRPARRCRRARRAPLARRWRRPCGFLACPRRRRLLGALVLAGSRRPAPGAVGAALALASCALAAGCAVFVPAPAGRGGLVAAVALAVAGRPGAVVVAPPPGLPPRAALAARAAACCRLLAAA